MKKIIALLITTALLLQSVTTFADNLDGDNITEQSIEIKLTVGEDNLWINGKNVKVETPFVENGVTLVPLRVITEAFGAEVFWDDAEKRITLNYKDVTIILAVNNMNAYVNGQSQPLLLAPCIRNSNTMVPLRFITENFGADVHWNGDDMSVIISLSNTKNNEIDDIASALNKSRKPKIGDSYLAYTWSMDLLNNFSLTEKTFDVRRATFESMDDDVSILVSITENADNMTLDNFKVKEREFMSSMTLIEQNTNATKSGIKYLCTTGKTKEYFVDSRVYINNKNVFEVLTYIDIHIDNDTRNKYIEMLNSFDFVFDEKTTDNISDIVDNFRLFNNEELGVQLRIPAHWHDHSNSSKINSFSFADGKMYDDFEVYATLDVYSIENYKTSEEWALADYEYNKNSLNPRLASFAQVSPITLGGIQGYYYKVEVKESGVKKISHHMFFHYEGYAYNLLISAPEDKVEVINSIANTLKLSKIDASKVGKLSLPLHDTDDILSTYENEQQSFRISVPTSWSNFQGSLFRNSDVSLEILITSLSSNDFDYSRFNGSGYRQYLEELGYDIVSLKSSNKVKGEIHQEILTDKETPGVYYQRNVFRRENTIFTALSTIDELKFSEFNQGKIYQILNSIEVNHSTTKSMGNKTVTINLDKDVQICTEV